MKRIIKNYNKASGFQKGHKANLGRTQEKSHHWKGDKASYFAIHIWVKKWKGKADHCESCGKNDKRTYQWSNVDHKYRRVLEDYIAMCVPCHKAYDRDILGLKVGR